MPFIQAVLLAALFALSGLLLFIILSWANRSRQSGIAPVKTVKLITGSTTDYVIVCPEFASQTVLDAAQRLKDAIRIATGAHVPIITDSPSQPPAQREILIGRTSRDFSMDALEMLAGRGYYSALKGSCLVLTGTDDDMVAAAVDSFIISYVMDCTSITLPAGYGDIIYCPEIISPARGEIEVPVVPVFTFTAGNGGEYTLEVLEPDGKGWKPIAVWKLYASAGETVRHNDEDRPLEACSVYMWRVTGTGASSAGVFTTKYDRALHPANVGLSFSFSDTISEKTLHNYLSRAINHNYFEHTDEDFLRQNKRFILNVGAKYIGHASYIWQPGGADESAIREHAKAIGDLHAADSDVIFEACIPETVFVSVGEIPIPEWVWRAFGLAPEQRSFNYHAMLFPEGDFVNHWGDGGSVPDIRQLETQLWYYYRAVTFIDAGFEALNFGQIELVGKRDNRCQCLTRVLNLIREHAAKNARRRFVLISATTHGLTGSDGKLLCDFHRYPARCVVPETEADHAPSEENPQKVIFSRGHADSIFGRSAGGRTHSGWNCDSLPYLVELDNGGLDNPATGLPKYIDHATVDWWGFDEISWFANQPYWYQRVFLAYAYRWVIETDRGLGHFEMPGTRTAILRAGEERSAMIKGTYYPFSSKFFEGGTDVENIVREIWTADNRKIIAERFQTH